MNTIKSGKAVLQTLLLLAILIFNFGAIGSSPVQAADCFTLTITATPTGEIAGTPVGGTVSANPPPNCGNQYEDGTIVTITAIPRSGYVFDEWKGAVTGTSNPTSVLMNGNKSVTATFPPSHNNFSSAKTIDKITYTDLNVVTTQATTQPGIDPDNIGPCDDGENYNEGNKTVWYTYTNNTNPPIAQSIAVDTKDSTPPAYDTFISVWRDTGGGSLSLVGCNDDNDQGYSEMTFIADPGATYYVLVAEYNGLEGGELGGNVGGTLQFHAYIRNIEVRLGTLLMGTYFVPVGEEERVYYNISGGPMRVSSLDNDTKNVAAIRLQSLKNNRLYSFVETMGVPSGLLSHKYYFPTYNNTWAPLNSQIRFGNLDPNPTTIRITIGGVNVWEDLVSGLEERRLYFKVSDGPVVIESLDPSRKIVAAIRLQSLANNTLFSFSETMGIPDEQLSHVYYFPTYNNTWAPLNSQIRFGNLAGSATTIRVTIGGVNVWQQSVPSLEERRLNFPVSDGPVVIESLDPDKKIVAAIRLQSLANNRLFSFIETMGVPGGLLSHKYYFPTYNNTWAPLNSQIRFGNLDPNPTTIRVTIGGVNVWEQEVPSLEERRLTFPVSGGPVIIESLDPSRKIVAAIRLQSLANNRLFSFAETMGIPDEQLSDTYYFPTYNNTWAPLNSQLRFGVP